MKNLIHVSILFVLLSLFTVILQSCSSENAITSPPNTQSKTTSLNTKSMAKQITNTNSISPDTSVYLPLSKKTILVSRSMSAEKIAMVDKYFSTHKNISTRTNVISPNLLTCGVHLEYDYEQEMDFQAVAGKSLGISNDLNLISCSDAKNIYGFSLYAASSFDNIETVHGAGFPYSNIMVSYLNPTNALAILQDTSKHYSKCGYYEIDEPAKYSYSYTDTKSLESLINNWNTGAKVLLTDFNWPEKTACAKWYNWGAQLGLYQGSNYYVMCDTYAADACGSPCDYWNEYTNYYSPAHVFSNWLDNVLAHWGYWDCCFKLANGTDQNINQIWLWAGTGDLTALQSFCTDAWENGWLLRQEKQIEIIWKCDTSNPCTNCIWPYGIWYISDSYYTGRVQYVAN